MKILRPLHFFLIGILFYNGLISQPNPQIISSDSVKIDSIKKLLLITANDTTRVNRLNDLSSIYSKQNIDSSLNVAEKALALGKQLDFKNGMANAHSLIGRILRIQRYYDSALIELTKALELRKENNDLAGVMNSYFDIGLVYSFQDNYPVAYGYFFQALREAEKIKDTINIIKILIEVGKNYEYQEDSLTAGNYFKQAIEYAELMVSEERLIASYSELAMTAFKIKQYQRALLYAIASLKKYFELGDYRNGAFEYITIGWIYKARGDSATLAGNTKSNRTYYFGAIDNFKKYKKYYVASKTGLEKWNISAVDIEIANVYLTLGDITAARKYFEESLGYGAQLKALDHLKSNYLGLYQIDSIEKNYKGALENYRLYTFYKESLTRQENLVRVEGARLQYEFDKKEALTRAEQYKKDEAARRIRNLQYFAFGIILLLAVFLFIYSRHKQKAKSKVDAAYAELKATQSQLIQSEKMASLGELTAGIAHEIQNPLNFVNNFSDVNKELLAELNDEVKKGNYTEVEAIAKDVIDNEEKINRHGKRADAIVKNMLQHSRASSGKKEPTDINALTEEYLRLSYHGLRAKDKSFNATMKTDFDNGIGKINIIPQDIGRVVLNLINNAFYAVDEKKKSMPPSPKGEEGAATYNYEPVVTVTTKRLNSPLGDRGKPDSYRVEIRIADNGNGIPQKVLDKIFQPFFTTKPTGQGTGLGLSLSYDIVKAHGGEIKVETIEAKGSEFIIQLPYIQQVK